MKNAINYFYNIIVDDIHQNEKMYYFDYMGMRYALLTYNGDVNLLKDIYNLHVEALRRGIFVHQIILNKDGQVATLINGVPYILMRVYYGDGDITLDSVLPFLSMNFNGDVNINRTNWGELWSNKIDYLEYEISQLGQKHPEIRETFSYFIGLGETSIQLVNMINVTGGKKGESTGNIIPKSISHDRIRSNDTLFDLYNPLNLVVDYRVRDVAEYFKHRYFDGYNIDSEVNSFLVNTSMTQDEYLLFFARMLYPTYYFDLYEDIISGAKDGNELKKIINRVNDYQSLMQSIYNYYKSFLHFVRIEWLEIT